MQQTMKLKHILPFALAAVAILPISTLAFVKPLRVVVPQLISGVHCYDAGICTDDKARLTEARVLYAAGVAKASEEVGPFHSRPTVTFCSTGECFDGFGHRTSAAFTLGNFGVVVAPRGWKDFYVTHELIHYRQAEELGLLAARRKPSWLIEGMAYSLSGDPQRPLPRPFEDWRAKFDAWNTPLHTADFWKSARKAE
jgi:hypothetical protein